MKSPSSQSVSKSVNLANGHQNGHLKTLDRQKTRTNKSRGIETTNFHPPNNGLGKQQLVSLNGSTICCNSVEIDEALACDVTPVTTPKTKALCVHIRENKWYDAGNTISVGVAGSSLNQTLENMPLTYTSCIKNIYEETQNTNSFQQHETKSQTFEFPNDFNKNSFVNSRIVDGELKEETNSLNDSPRNSLPHSCSSTVSSLSEFSPSGSFQEEQQQQSSPEKGKLWPLNTSFVKNVFSWKTKERLPSSPTRNVDRISGSLALIQQPRPANLPAKCAIEEENHRRQYNAILISARKRELKEERERKNQRAQQLRDEQRLAEDSLMWNTQVLPQFEGMRNMKKVRELWWRGLPPSVRGKVWKLAINNSLNITSNLYNLCLDRALSNPINETLAAIKLDVSRTFSSLCVFQDGGPLAESLQGVLAAYAVYRPDIGYVQGMSFIGGVLSLNMDATDAFTCFANLLNSPCHRAAFSLDQKQMNIYYKVYVSALGNKLPKIYAHFAIAGLSPDLYLLDWLYTIYAKAMPLDVVSRIWDMFLRDGDEFLFRTALGVLHLYQEELLKMDFVRGAQFLTRLPENIQADALFNSISQMSTSIGTTSFHQMLAQISSV
ncbi:TBC1 domain family member 14-like [Leptopilina boulardi]|uniref:TBC1 domain family member 14-like n=1 Tax=Leptopilina boulardi TaxID=63433 RepID=UPI0021F55F2E|nr:TBC1 domain family member 14-like [Leptopilina boulardi]